MQVNVTHLDIFIDILTLGMLNILRDMHIFLRTRLIDFFSPLLLCTCIRTEAAWKLCGSRSVTFSVDPDQLENSVDPDWLASV